MILGLFFINIAYLCVYLYFYLSFKDMKRKILLLVLGFIPFFFFAQTVRTVNITAGNLWKSIPKAEKAGITGLTITGAMDARDFVQLRDSFPALNTVDLDNVSVAAYTGSPANTIPDNAFTGRNLFTSFVLPKTITTVGANAFNGCTAVTAINFPASLVKIDPTSFRNFGGKFTVDAASTAFSAYNGVLYNKSQSDLIQAPISLAGSYTLPATVTTIKTYAFYACNKVTDIISNNTAPLLTEDFAFQNCSGLLTFSTKASVATFSISSCEGCIKLKTFTGNNVKVGARSFFNCQNLTTFTGSILELDVYSFYNCVSLTGFTLTSSITRIPDASFAVCRSLTSVSLPVSVTEVGGSAFSSCTKLTTINANFTSLKDAAFYGCTELVSISGTITALGNNTFLNCSKLKTISVAPSIVSIGNSAFEGCTSLPSFSVSAQVKTIGSYAFRNCSALITVDAGNTYYSSNGGVLFDKAGLNLIQSPISKTGIYSIPEGTTTLKSYSLYRNRNINTLIIPKSVCTIEPAALLECPAKLVITSDNPCLYTSDGLVIFNKDSTVLIYCSPKKSGAYTMPNSVEEIRDYAFANCNLLTSITMNSGLVKIGNYAFSASAISAINIPTTVTDMGESAFSSCTKALSIVIPPSLTTISKNAFAGCNNVVTVSLPNTLTTIGENAFLNCSKWTGTLVIPPSVNYIDKNAFNGCASLTGTVDIPSGLAEINDGVFANCTKLQNVNIPPNISTIGVYAFNNCRSFVKFIIPATVTTIKTYAFNSCIGLTSLYANAIQPIDLSPYPGVFNAVNKNICTLFVPAGSKKLYQKAVQWKDFLHIIEGEGFWIGKDTVYLKDVASKDSVIIGSNTTWTTRVLPPADSWLTASPQTGSLDGKIYVFATENISEKRIGYVVIESKDSKDTLVVVQARTAKIRDYNILIKALRQCGHQAYSFEASPRGGSFTYMWDFGDGKTSSGTQNPVTHDYDELKSATYNITLKVNLGQYNRTFTTKFTTEKLPDLVLDNKPFMCPGDTMIVHVKGADKYLWNNGSTDDFIKITRPGTYTVKGTKGDTLCTVVPFEVKYFPTYNYTIEMEKKAVPSFIPLIHLWATDIPGSTYYWEFSDGGKAEGREIFYLLGNTSERFNFLKLNIITPDGCHQSYAELFEIEKKETPNTFTPNGDGMNDVFLKGYSLKILDRFGQLLYEGEEGWDGTYKGKLMPQDTYFYVISFKTQSGVKQISNYVMLLR